MFLKKRRFQFGISFVLLVMIAVAGYFAARPHVRAFNAMRELSNDDMIVNGSTFGLLVFIEGRASETLLDLDTDANPWLLAALSNEDQFAAAHYLLWRINHEEFKEAWLYWDSYHLDPFASGSTDFDVSQMPGIRSFWTKLLKQPDGFTEDDLQIQFSYFEKADYQIGDLVPCDKEQAEFEMTIQAVLKGESLVEFRQTFCRHRDKETDPIFQFGISPQDMEDPDLTETDACSADIKGVFQYASLNRESLGMMIDWRIPQADTVLRFRSEFEVRVGEMGEAPTRDLEDGILEWKFETAK